MGSPYFIDTPFGRLNVSISFDTPSFPAHNPRPRDEIRRAIDSLDHSRTFRFWLTSPDADADETGNAPFVNDAVFTINKIEYKRLSGTVIWASGTKAMVQTVTADRAQTPFEGITDAARAHVRKILGPLFTRHLNRHYPALHAAALLELDAMIDRRIATLWGQMEEYKAAKHDLAGDGEE